MSVYFVASKDGFIKIGWSDNPEKRIQSLQVGLYEDLETLLIVDGSRSHERHAHRAVGAHRVRGEWFKDCAEVRVYIDRVRSGDWGGYVAELLTSLSEQTQTCVWAADVIRRCASFAGMDETLNHGAFDLTDHNWKVSKHTLHKFSYRDREARMSEYMELLKGIEIAANHVRSLLDDAVDQARSILDGHAADLASIREMEQTITRMEASLIDTPAVRAAEALVAEAEAGE